MSDAKQLTESDKMWSELKDKEINMFGLEGQTVSMHATRLDVEPSKVYLKLRSSAVLPALDDAFGKKFNFELADKYVIVSRKV